MAKAHRAVTALMRRATARGAEFRGLQRVVAVEHAHGQVTGVRTAEGTVPADVVVSCAGFWGPEVGELVGMRVPLLPLAHQYVKTGQVPDLVGRNSELGEASLPILRHQDKDLYYREHVDRIGIGSYAHRPMPVRLDELPEGEVTASAMPSMLPFTEEDFAPSWEDSQDLLPALRGTKVEEGVQRDLLLHPRRWFPRRESRDVAGFHIAEAVWVTHSAGVARALAQTLVDGFSEYDLHGLDVHRFEEVQLTESYVSETRSRTSSRSTTSCTRCSRGPLRATSGSARSTPAARPRRVLPGVGRLGASALVRGERGAARRAARGVAAAGPEAWAAQFHSPVAAVEAWKTRTAVAMYDMTPLKRLEVSGPGAVALLERLTTSKMDKSVGSVTYTLFLEEDGGIRSDVTVARLAADVFQVGANGHQDDVFLEQQAARHAEEFGPVHVRDVTGGTACIGCGDRTRAASWRRCRPTTSATRA